MEDMNEALITGEVLRWARERRGLDYAQLAHAAKIAIEQLRQWEEGISWPPFGKAQALAKTLKIPFGVLFLPKPPSDSYPIPDFRTFTADNAAELSPDLVDVINQVATKQEWFHEYCEQNSEPRLAFVGSMRMTNGVQAVARDIEEKLNINEELRRSCSNWSSYMTRLCDRAQEIGVLVMRSGIVGSDVTRPLNLHDFRGFALTDPYAPVVFINSRDSYSAQVFTLIHEICHIWINQSGISNPDPSETPNNDFEVFCDGVAAEVLAPVGEFEAAWTTVLDRASFPATLSRVFWVSPLVVIRRAYEREKINEAEFFRLVRIEKDRTFKVKKKSGGNPDRTLFSRNGRRLTLGVLSAVKQNRLVYADAARILSVRLMRIPKLLGKSFA